VQAVKQKLKRLSLYLELDIDEECPASVIEVVAGRGDLTQVTVSKVP
jgi:hypothetical protein